MEHIGYKNRWPPFIGMLQRHPTLMKPGSRDVQLAIKSYSPMLEAEKPFEFGIEFERKTVHYNRYYVSFAVPRDDAFWKNYIELIIFDAAVCRDTGVVAIRDEQVLEEFQSYLNRVVTKNIPAKQSLAALMGEDEKVWHLTLTENDFT